MNAVAPALVGVVSAVLRKLVGANQREEVRLLAGFKQFARLGDMLVFATQSLGQVTSTDPGRTERRCTNATALRCLDQDARVTRMHWQPQHLPTGRLQFLGLRISRAESPQQ